MNNFFSSYYPSCLLYSQGIRTPILSYGFKKKNIEQTTGLRGDITGLNGNVLAKVNSKLNPKFHYDFWGKSSFQSFDLLWERWDISVTFSNRHYHENPHGAKLAEILSGMYSQHYACTLIPKAQGSAPPRHPTPPARLLAPISPPASTLKSGTMIQSSAPHDGFGEPQSAN